MVFFTVRAHTDRTENASRIAEVRVIPFNDHNALGSCLPDRFLKCILKDVVLIQGKNAKERAKARKSRLITLNCEYDRSLGHSRHAVIVFFYFLFLFLFFYFSNLFSGVSKQTTRRTVK